MRNHAQQFHSLPVQQQRWILLNQNPIFKRWFLPANCLPCEPAPQQPKPNKKRTWLSRIYSAIKGVFHG